MDVDIKRKIEAFEYGAGGYMCISGVGVKAVNVKVRKETVKADIIITHYEDKITERFNDCEYPLTMFNGK